MITLRPYQLDLIERVRVALRKHRRVLIVLPTGGGKTVLAAHMAGTSSRKNMASWFNCHRDFLIAQTSGTFEDVGIDHAFIAAGWTWQPHHLVQVCSIPTLSRRLDKLVRPKMMVWDECHHIAAGNWAKIMAWAPDAYHIGLTASPWRLDGKGLGDFFEVIVEGPTVAQLMEWGNLSRYKAYAPGAPDITGLHSRYGDVVQSEAEEVMDKGVIIGDIVRHYKSRALGKRGVYFGQTVKHSKHIAEAFNCNGVRAVHLDGECPSKDRSDAALALARGDLDVITNKDLFGEGYDLDAQAKAAGWAGAKITIDVVGLCRITQSLSLHIQQMGRVLRPKEDGSHGVILDHAGNIGRLGFPDDEREWTLDGDTKKKAGDGGPPTRQCKECFHIHKPAPVCPECGYRYPTGEAAREVEHLDGELHELDPAVVRHNRKMEEWMCESEADLVKLGQRRGYQWPEAWARRMMQLRQANKSKGADGRVRQSKPPMPLFNDPV